MGRACAALIYLETGRPGCLGPIVGNRRYFFERETCASHALPIYFHSTHRLFSTNIVIAMSVPKPGVCSLVTFAAELPLMIATHASLHRNVQRDPLSHAQLSSRHRDESLLQSKEKPSSRSRCSHRTRKSGS